MKRSFFYLLVLIAVTFVTYSENKPYITRVLEYCPAPGQFINVIPSFSEGEPQDSILSRALHAIEPEFFPERTITFLGQTYYVPADTDFFTSNAVSLGGFGGYVVFGFDHSIINAPNQLDFQIAGNGSAASSEPGIVMVSRDDNNNGMADDLWYELAGSEYYKTTTQHNFKITYYKTPENHIATGQGGYTLDDTYILWKSNSIFGDTIGYIEKNIYNTQNYWPLWNNQDSITFSGTLLHADKEYKSQTFPTNYYDWGYVDNCKDYLYDYAYTDTVGQKCNLGFNIEWAIDSLGNPVHLEKIDFIKVYTAVHQNLKQFGEASTEVGGAIDLHPDAVLTPSFIIGDVNGDGIINGTDVTALFNLLLSGNTSVEDHPAADVDQNGIINGQDVTALYNLLL